MSGTTRVIRLHQPKQTQNGFIRRKSDEQSSGSEPAAVNSVAKVKTHSEASIGIKENKIRSKLEPTGPNQLQDNQQQIFHHQARRRLSDEKELVQLLASFGNRAPVLESNEKLGATIGAENNEPPIKRAVKAGELKETNSWEQFYSFPRLHVPDCLIESSLGDPKVLEPFVLQPSLFHQNHVPPTIYFNTKLSEDSKPPIGLPASLQHMFKWKISSITPNTIRNCVLFMKFEIVRQSNIVDNYYIGAWCKHMPTVDFGAMDAWRKVNHYPGSFHMGRKDKLWLRLRLASQKYDLTEFHPRTFVLPKDYDELDEYWRSSPSNLFIIKPPASARGNGVKVINNISQIPETALRPLPAQQGQDGPMVTKKSTMIVQQYIANPCLLENRQKFDLRIYVLVTSVDPLKIYVYDEGLVRFASSKYTSQEDGIIDQYMHLTNYFVNKNNQDYQINNDCDSLNGCKWTLKRFWRYIDEHFEHVDAKELWDQIIDIIIKTIICCETPMTRLSHVNCKNDYSSYELFGFDIILDENFKPWILEVNITPSLKSESNLDTSVKFRVIKDMFNLVGYHLPPPPVEQPNPMASHGECRLFFDERLYKEMLTKQDKIKHQKYQRLFKLESNNSRRLITPQHATPTTSLIDEQHHNGQSQQDQPHANMLSRASVTTTTTTSASQSLTNGIQNNDINQIRGTKQERTTISDDESSTSKSVDDEDILSNLTQSDIRVLMLAEDELSRCGQFKRVLPSTTSSKYLKYFDKPRYYNLLLDAWERRYGSDRIEGIKRLSSLAKFLD